MAEELLVAFSTELQEIVLTPGIGGVFDVTVNEKLVFSKDRMDRFPTIDDIKPKVEAVLG